jgi:hypothetical protein
MMLHKNNVTRRSKALFKLSALYFTKSTMAAFTTNRNFLEWLLGKMAEPMTSAQQVLACQLKQF